MRQLGSFFHIAMNGMAASDKIFRLLDLPEEEQEAAKPVPQDCSLRCQAVRFSYEAERDDPGTAWTWNVPRAALRPWWGNPAAGNPPVASLLMGRNRGYQGSVTVGGVELSALKEESLLRKHYLHQPPKLSV